MRRNKKIKLSKSHLLKLCQMHADIVSCHVPELSFVLCNVLKGEIIHRAPKKRYRSISCITQSKVNRF